MNWIADNAGWISPLASVLTLLVWVVYLQLFLMTYLRQRRTEILISIGAGRGLGARCFVANLGMEPIYISDILLTVGAGDQQHRAAVTECNEVPREDLNTPASATNQGPLRAAQSHDIGAFDTLIARARNATGAPLAESDLRELRVLVIGWTASTATLVAAERSFDIVADTSTPNGAPRVRPNDLRTHQIRSFFVRRRLQREMAERL
ncbi:hypothetical protein [Halodurantibacterium flavum]|uniref:Uncharacterized protein n=1 Tax=Halodurantibacterium flavum TaxID=1382802 RepID=A0ABW4S669_9RHOB